ncbi:MAG: anti-sigma factor antagonist [Phycisphaerales bacterium]|nr:MAG: anti-sigma factor antagonist [Phycisphaerales bacterium]
MPDASDKSHLTFHASGDVTVVEFSDRKILDELSINEIGEELTGLVGRQPGIRLLLNFRNVEHLSSAALGMLIKLNQAIGEKRGSMKLSNISPQIYEVFKITRLNEVFDIHDTADRALAAF